MSAERHSRAQVVTVVGSQGALPVARGMLAALDDDFPAPVVYVQHRVASAGSVLANLLRFHVRLPVVEVADGDPVEPGVLYLPRPDVQTTIGADRRFHVSAGKCLGDPVMIGAAGAYGHGALGVVLSGRLRDGSAGLQRIKHAGGRGLVQAPDTAEADGMPLSALATGCYDFVLAPDRLAAALVTLVAVPGAADLFSVRANPVAAAIAV